MEKFLKQITKEAGKKLLFWFKEGDDLAALRGDTKEIVTKYDKAIDKFLFEEVERNYPKHSILTEESGLRDKKSDFLWIIDSLDGSGNFANKNPFFSVCVALLRNGKLCLGAIFAPALDEFYFAKKGEGAFLNEKRIHVSNIDKLGDSYVVYCEGNEKNREKLAKSLLRIYPKVKDLRKIGSAGIETTWIATGRADGYFTTKIDPWDVAVGVLLVEEGGGKVSNFEGDLWHPHRSNLIFSNGKIHPKLINLLK